MQDFIPFFIHHSFPQPRLFSFPLSISSGLQRDLLHQLFLPVLWQQRVSHDRSALPVRRYQHRFLECPGRADGRALPLWQEVGNLGMPWNLLDNVKTRSVVLSDVLNDVTRVALRWLVGLQGWMTLWGEIVGSACDVERLAVLLPPNGFSRSALSFWVQPNSWICKSYLMHWNAA